MIFNKKTMWAKPTPQQRQDKEARVEETKKSISEVKQAAALCLASPLFQDYLRKLENGREGIIALFAAVDIADPIEEWKIFKELQKEYVQLQYLLRSVNRDASAPVAKVPAL